MTRKETVDRVVSHLTEKWGTMPTNASELMKQILLTLEALDLIKFDEPESLQQYVVFDMNDGRSAQVLHEHLVGALAMAGYDVVKRK